LEGYNGKKPKKLEKLDELFLTKTGLLVQRVTKSFENYEYSKAKIETEKFFWNMFCNNYLEIVKKRIYQEKGNKKLSAQYTLYKSLLIILKLIAPIMPFITEEIYQEHFRKIEKDKSIHISEWPKSENMNQKNLDKVSSFGSLIDLISKIRQEKSNNKKSMNSECIITLDKKNLRALGNMQQDFENVTNAKEIKQGKFKVEFE
jgi:valyl-tRNA synthetase